MKISVITVTYNSAATIVDTVASVLGQTHPDVEYMIVDGASTDDTLAKLEPYRERLAGLLSEPDRGIAADYEFMLRVLQAQQRSAAYLPEVLVKMRTGGASNRSIRNIWKANMECYRAWRMHGYGPLRGGAAVVRKPFTKLKQLGRR